jgi:hypothetical protein
MAEKTRARTLASMEPLVTKTPFDPPGNDAMGIRKARPRPDPLTSAMWPSCRLFPAHAASALSSTLLSSPAAAVPYSTQHRTSRAMADRTLKATSPGR